MGGEDAARHSHVRALGDGEKAAVGGAMVEFAGDLVAETLDANIRTADCEVAGIVGVLRFGLVGDGREVSAADDEGFRVRWIGGHAGDRVEVPDNRRARIDGAVGVHEDDLLLGRTIVLVRAKADVLLLVPVLDDHQAGTVEFHADVRLSALESLHALDRMGRLAGGNGEDGTVAFLDGDLGVVDDELRGAEVDVGLHDGGRLARPDVVGPAIPGSHGDAALVGCGMGLDDGRLVVGLAVANRAEFLIGHEISGPRARARRQNQRKSRKSHNHLSLRASLPKPPPMRNAPRFVK